MCSWWQGNVWICMDVMDISLEPFYRKVHTLHGRFDEDVLSVIAFSVCVEILAFFSTCCCCWHVS